jgi:aspartate/methionine/tyrosine aminotransferase
LSKRYPFAVIKEKLHARRGEVSDFAIGARRVPLAQELHNWIRQNPDLALKPAGPADLAAFKEAAIDYMQHEYAVEISAEQIVPVPSGRVGMSAFIACDVEPGTGVVVTEPGYPAFARMAKHRHAEVHSVVLDPEHDFSPDFESLSSSQRENVRVIALNYPNNPTAAVIGRETRDIIESAARASNASIFNDAVYGPLIYEGGSHCLLSDAADDIDLVELHSLTKLFPLGPLSGSFLAGSAASIVEIAHYSEFAWAPMSVLQMQATIWCLQDDDSRHEIRDNYSAQLAALTNTLREVGFQPFPTPSGIYALCRLPKNMAGRQMASAEQAATILLDEFDIAVMPWDLDSHSYLRFCSMYLPEDLQRLRDAGERLQIADSDAGG